MNSVDAYQILASELSEYRALAYAELAELVGPGTSRRVLGKDSIEYSIQVNVRWRTGESGEILVEGWIAEDSSGPLHRLDDSFAVLPP